MNVGDVVVHKHGQRMTVAFLHESGEVTCNWLSPVGHHMSLVFKQDDFER